MQSFYETCRNITLLASRMKLEVYNADSIFTFLKTRIIIYSNHKSLDPLQGEPKYYSLLSSKTIMILMETNTDTK